MLIILNFVAVVAFHSHLKENLSRSKEVKGKDIKRDRVQGILPTSMSTADAENSCLLRALRREAAPACCAQKTDTPTFFCELKLRALLRIDISQVEQQHTLFTTTLKHDPSKRQLSAKDMLFCTEILVQGLLDFSWRTNSRKLPSFEHRQETKKPQVETPTSVLPKMET